MMPPRPYSSEHVWNIDSGDFQHSFRPFRHAAQLGLADAEIDLPPASVTESYVTEYRLRAGIQITAFENWSPRSAVLVACRDAISGSPSNERLCAYDLRTRKACMRYTIETQFASAAISGGASSSSSSHHHHPGRYISSISSLSSSIPHLLALSTNTGHVAFLDDRTGKFLATWRPHTSMIHTAHVLQDNKILFASQDRSITVWDLRDKLARRPKMIRRVDAPGTPVSPTVDGSSIFFGVGPKLALASLRGGGTEKATVLPLRTPKSRNQNKSAITSIIPLKSFVGGEGLNSSSVMPMMMGGHRHNSAAALMSVAAASFAPYVAGTDDGKLLFGH
eukprot:CAMPEP_0185259518 /NCGR_PEP_ID=MMETSP1359-20130426/8274_1 /TAXON_ID=552665 /ORGANISM="Bigelowiella longifila, Strain CCMP242" /LENGTH=334 /DNA_ID=CAMNT_0027845449 /DNA_START=5 /DNA_END=1009 /DNA_ORIENTATION=+